jgi:LacI family transcriptional regulator
VRPPTLSDVAAAAQVSLSTASRTLNGSAEIVREDLRRRVLEVARELGYVPNAQAQALVRATTSTIGLVVHDISDPYFSAIARGVVEVATDRRLFVMIASDFADPDRELAYLSALAAQRVRAIILAGSGFEDPTVRERAVEHLRSFARLGGRVACISEHGIPFDTVLLENHTGALRLTERLLARGHTEFGVIAGPRSLTTARHRLEGIVSALSAAGITLGPERIVDGGFNRNRGHTAALELVDRVPNLTALIAVTDLMAVGALTALRERGIAVPDQISVAGFDDIELARDVHPALTTARVPMAGLGMRAAELVLSDPAESPRRVPVQTEIIERASTR